MQSLPDFGDRLRARDCELMLQYLTVPYIRIPLVIKFFADPVRMQVHIYGICVIYDVYLHRGRIVDFEQSVGVGCASLNLF